MKRSSLRLSLFGALAGVLASGMAQAASLSLSGLGGHYSVPVTSFAENKFRHLVRQQYDFSCGSAALATLLTHHYGHPVDEQQVFEAMFALGDQARIRRAGFSMLDMKNYLASVGFEAGGYRLGLDRLQQTAVPAVALLSINGYLHFVVVKGVRSDQVLIGDPALGLRTMPRAQFEAGWNGIFFLIRSHASIGKQAFNRDTEWAALARAPLEQAVSRQDIGSFTLNIPLPGMN